MSAVPVTSSYYLTERSTGNTITSYVHVDSIGVRYQNPTQTYKLDTVASNTVYLKLPLADASSVLMASLSIYCGSFIPISSGHSVVTGNPVGVVCSVGGYLVDVCVGVPVPVAGYAVVLDSI